MPRSPEERLTLSQHRARWRRALQNLGVEQRVAGAAAHTCQRRDFGRDLDTARAREPDIEVLRLERCRVGRPRRDQVLVAIVEPRAPYARPILGEPLLDAGLHAARSFGLQIRIAAEERRRAER